MNEKQTKWDESFKAGRDYNPMNEILLDLLLSQTNNDKEIAIDLGCGTGDAALKLAQRGMTVIGTDWASDAIEKASNRIKEAGFSEEVSFKAVDLNLLHETNFEKGKADVVLCKLVIAFVEDKKLFCETVKTLLNSNGVFIIQTPVLHNDVQYTPEDKPGIGVNYKEFKTTLNEVFSEVSEFNHSYYGERGDLVTFLVT